MSGIAVSIPANMTHDSCMVQNATGLNFIGDSISNCLLQNAYGDMAFAGIMFLGFFLAYMVLQNTRVETKAVILIPVFILSAVFFNWMLVMVAIVASFIMFLALNKGLNIK